MSKGRGSGKFTDFTPERFARVYKKHDGDFKIIAKELEVTIRTVQRLYNKYYKNSGTEEEKEEAKKLEQKTKKARKFIKAANEATVQTYTDALDTFKENMANNQAKIAKLANSRLDFYMKQAQANKLKASATELTSLLNSGSDIFGKLISKEEDIAQNNIQVNFELPALKSTIKKDVENSN